MLLPAGMAGILAGPTLPCRLVLVHLGEYPVYFELFSALCIHFISFLQALLLFDFDTG